MPSTKGTRTPLVLNANLDPDSTDPAFTDRAAVVRQVPRLRYHSNLDPGFTDAPFTDSAKCSARPGADAGTEVAAKSLCSGRGGL